MHDMLAQQHINIFPERRFRIVNPVLIKFTEDLIMRIIGLAYSQICIKLYDVDFCYMCLGVTILKEIRNL